MTDADENIQDVLEKLAVLEPTPADAPTPAIMALARLKRRAGQSPSRNHSLSDLIGRFHLMFKRKYAVATILVLFVSVAAFSFPGVRAAASDFLGLFRVQKFAPISVSPAQLALLEDLANQGLYPGQFEMLSEPGQPQTVDSAGAAAALVNSPVRSPAALGQPTNVHVTQAGQGRLTIDLASARAILQAAGADPTLLPDSLDGAAVDVTIFPAVVQSWDGGITLMQTESPLVDYPDDVNPAVIGEALLQLLGMAPGEARRIAQNIDWTNTLLLPIPEDLATFGEVRVDGVTGLAINSLRNQNSTLMWQKDGLVYVLSGMDGSRELLAIANSLR